MRQALPRILLLTSLLLPTGLQAADQYVVVVLDDSGSMRNQMRSSRSRKMDAAKEALKTVLADVPDEAEVGVLTLNSRVDGSPWIVPLGSVDRSAIEKQIAWIRADGSTPLGAAMKAATDALLEARRKNIYGTYRLLVVTDGEATDQVLVEKYLPAIRSRGVVTDVIGVDMRRDHSLATKVNTYRRADNRASLAKAIAEVFAETSDEDAGAGESDYDLLGGLDDQVATAAVQSLAKMSNQPIGEEVQPQLADRPTASPPGPGPPTAPPATPTADGGGAGLGTLCMSGFCMFVVFVAFLTLASQMGRRRK